MRISRDRGDKYDWTREWMLPHLKRVRYVIMDYFDTYHPNVVGDIHHLPFASNSVDGLICMAVLEHIENPMQACQELYRVLEPGGYCFVFVPFLYHYHADPSYYKDYWRFSKDAIDVLFNKFSFMEKQSVRGALGTWLRNSRFDKSRV